MALTNSQYDQIMRSYEEKQRISRLRLEQKKAEIYAKVPAIRALDEEIAGFSVHQAKLLLDGDAHALTDLKDKLAQAQHTRAQLLAEAGYKPQDLQPVYSCPDCRDTGYMAHGVRCHCFRQAAIDLIYTQSNIKNIMYMPLFVTILSVGIVLAYLSGTVLRPIAKINYAAKEFAKGNFEVKTGVNRRDEIGELSDSLEYMASELSKLDEYRRNFIANISHDFRSPLTSIKGYLEAMLDGTIPVERYDRYLKIVLNESKRLTKLTSGLLELNDFDTYGPILKKSSFDILEVVKETHNTVEGLCEDKKIDFSIQCQVKNTTVYADKMKIGQVIYNLIDNAIKFSPNNSSIIVTISEKNDKMFLSVKDAGPGIERDKQNKVFDRFYKTDSSRGKDKQGTGLGLAIVKEIIKAHGENINLISTEGVGSEFVFTLPKSPNKEEKEKKYEIYSRITGRRHDFFHLFV